MTVETLLSQAHDAVGKGDTELAVRLAQSAIVADPARPASYVALGDIYAQDRPGRIMPAPFMTRRWASIPPSPPR